MDCNKIYKLNFYLGVEESTKENSWVIRKPKGWHKKRRNVKNPVIHLITIDCIVNQWLLLESQREMRASSQTETSLQPADTQLSRAVWSLGFDVSALQKSTLYKPWHLNPAKFSASLSMLGKIIAVMPSEKIIKYIHLFKALVWLPSTKIYLFSHLEFPVSS